MTYHVYPVGDLIDHDTDDDGCVCGPEAQPVVRDDGSIGWVLVHHSLDGRERAEGGRSGVRRLGAYLWRTIFRGA